MPVTERVMALGDWSLRLRDDTPLSVRKTISTPFAQLVLTQGRMPLVGLTDGIALQAAFYTGVVLRPGPQLELGGCGLEWFLSGSDQSFGAGFMSTVSISAGSLSSAVSTVLSGTGFTSGTITSGTVQAYVGADVTRGMVLRQLAEQLGYQFRFNPDLSVDVGTVAALYGSSPNGVVVRRVGPKEVAPPFGVVGSVANSWDWEGYASASVVWTTSERSTSGGASTYRGPGGSLMTIYRGWEIADAPAGAASGIAAELLSKVNGAYRTVEVSSEDYAITPTVPCGGSVWLYDVENGLVDPANQILFGGGMIHPVSARVVSVTFPIEDGMGVFIRQHDGTAATYTDISDYVEYEPAGVRMEVSTAAQFLTPRTASTLQDLWSPWQTYTPNWDGDTTDPVIGTGTITGRYRRLGTSLQVSITITANATTNFGTGNMSLTLPAGCTARNFTNSMALGKCTVFDGTDVWHGTAYVNANTSSIYLASDASPWVNWEGSTNKPKTWGATDKINVEIWLEVGP